MTIFIGQMEKIIGKNGEITYELHMGDATLIVTPRPGDPNNFDLHLKGAPVPNFTVSD